MVGNLHPTPLPIKKDGLASDLSTFLLPSSSRACCPDLPVTPFPAVAIRGGLDTQTANLLWADVDAVVVIGDNVDVDEDF